MQIVIIKIRSFHEENLPGIMFSHFHSNCQKHPVVDIVILAKNIATLPAHEISNVGVLMTMVVGKTILKK